MNKFKNIVLVFVAAIVLFGGIGEVQASTIVFSGNEPQLLSQYGTLIQQDMQANGGVSLGSSGLYGGNDGVTQNRICEIIDPDSTATYWQSDDYSSPGNNTIVKWNGSSWSKHGASGYNSHIRNNLTCTKYTPPTPPAPVNYAAYCGDGIQNQTWEQCDGGGSCTQQCQDTTLNQCADLILARVNISTFDNDFNTYLPSGGPGSGGGSYNFHGQYYNILKAVTNVAHAITYGGDMTSNIFVGSSLNVMPEGTWFPVYYNGSYYNDANISGYEDVPGLAVQRTQGRITTLMHGSHGFSGGAEHVQGNIELWNASVTSQSNNTSGNNTFEKGTDGNMEMNALQDEYWKSGGKSYFWSTVTIQDDSFHTNYSANTPICVVPPTPQPTLTFNTNPVVINNGGSSTITWNSGNTTSCTGTNFNTGGLTSGSVVVSPTVTTAYGISCTGPYGSITGDGTVYVTNIPVTPAPTCDLDLSASQISWGTIGATHVVINPTTNSPAVPGAYGGGYGGNGNVVFSGTETQLMNQYGTIIHQDMQANGGVYQGNAGIYGGQGGSTIDHICELIDPTSSATYFGHDDYSSPGNNTIVKWNGSSWSKHGASGYNNHLRGSLTCTSYTPPTPHPLNGLHNFIPNLQPGTHTYQLTATGPGGVEMCEETVVVPYPGETLAFTADPENITAGDPVQVVWDSENTTSCIGTNFDTSGATSGSVTVYPSVDTTYEISCTGPGGSIGDNDTVYVTPSPIAPTADLDLTPTTNVDPGDDVQLTWTSTNTTSCVGTNFSTGGATSGSITVYPFTNTTYSVLCTGPGGTATDADTVLVNASPTVDLEGDPTTIDVGDDTELIWDSDNTNTCASTDFSTGGTTSGSVTVSPTVTTEYEISCTGPNGTVTDSVTITVNTGGGGDAPTCTLEANPQHITIGSTAELTWTSTDTTSVSIDNGVGTVTPVDGGDEDVSPSSTTNYTATFTGPGGTATCSTEVTVDIPPGTCVGNCGGGGGPPFDPHISLSINDDPGEQPLAFVSLSQIPYTGFGAGPVLTTIFWMIVLGISTLLGHLIVSRGIMHKFMTLVSQYGANMYNNNAQNNNMNFTAPVQNDINEEEEEDEIATDPTDLSGLSGSLETRAHEENILVSSEGLNIVVGLGGGTEHGAFEILETLLKRAKDTYPREDGWILLNTKRVHNLLPHTTAPTTPEVEEEEEAIEENKVQAPTEEDDNGKEDVDSSVLVIEFIKNMILKDVNKTFEILRDVKDMTPPDFIAQVVCTLDEVYKDRLEGYRNKNEEVTKLLSDWTDDSLEGVIEILAEAIDHSYKSNRIGVKVALTKMFNFLG